MYWLKKTDEQAQVVRFKVLGGYEYREALRRHGFDFNRRQKFWFREVAFSEPDTMRSIEDFLRACDRLDQNAAKWRRLSEG